MSRRRQLAQSKFRSPRWTLDWCLDSQRIVKTVFWIAINSSQNRISTFFHSRWRKNGGLMERNVYMTLGPRSSSQLKPSHTTRFNTNWPRTDGKIYPRTTLSSSNVLLNPEWTPKGKSCGVTSTSEVSAIKEYRTGSRNFVDEMKAGSTLFWIAYSDYQLISRTERIEESTENVVRWRQNGLWRHTRILDRDLRSILRPRLSGAQLFWPP